MNPLKVIQSLMQRGKKPVELGPRVDNLPAVAPTPATMPGLELTRRDLLKRAGAQAAGAAADISPAGALAKLAADPVKSTALKAASKVVQETKPIARTLSDLDHAAREGMLWSLNETGDLDAMLGVWSKLRPKLELGLEPSMMRRMDELAKTLREGRVVDDYVDDIGEEVREFYEKLRDVLDQANVPPEVVHKTLPADLRVRPDDAEDWVNAVASENMDRAPNPEQVEALHTALFGAAPKPITGRAVTPRPLALRDLTPFERAVSNDLWGRLYTDNNEQRVSSGLLSAWETMKSQLDLSTPQVNKLDRMAQEIAKTNPTTQEGYLARLEFNKALEPLMERVPPEFMFDVVRDYARLRSAPPEEALEKLRRMDVFDKAQPGEVESVYQNLMGGQR